MKIYFDGSPTRHALWSDTESHVEEHEETPYDRPIEIEYAAFLFALGSLSKGSKCVLISDNQSLDT
ncbi:MAG: hypothetical protein NWE89_14470 [Candidatus Bathyarchaeota archaeon]|nr:hypothetical protein [Candidatus Bathyarchaeota archaeon]